MARIMKILQFSLLAALCFTSIYPFLQHMYVIKVSSLKNCDQALDEFRFKNVNDSTLKEVFYICNKDDLTLNVRTNKSINNYLQHSLETFYCSRPLRNLKVPRPYVALASFPGSGNTWTRLLIEAATGMNWVEHVLKS